MMYDLGQGILREDLSLARGRLLEGKVNFALQALDAYITLDELLDLLDLTSEDIGSRADGEISDIRTKAGIEIAKNYAPTQPRDSLGRFASAGSYGSLGPSGFINQVRADYKDTLTAEQKIEVMSYTDSSYQYTNPTLREVRGDISKLDDYRKETVKQLDSAMIHKLKGDTELYRGVDIEGQFLKGDVINNFGYSSTTFGKDTAEKFAIDASGPKSAKVLTIKAKAGQKGLIPAIISDNDVDVSLRGQEKEYLLPRNLKLKVTDTKQRTGDVNGDKFKYTEVITEIIK